MPRGHKATGTYTPNKNTRDSLWLVRELHTERLRQGLSVERLCRKTDYSIQPNTIRQWECGHNAPKLEFYVRWAKALGLELDLIVAEKPQSASPRVSVKESSHVN